MLNVQLFLQQYVLSQITRTLSIALIIIVLLLIFNIFFLKKPISLYLAFITLLPLFLSGIVFIFTPLFKLQTGGLYTVGLVWFPFLINAFYIIASLNKENSIITNTKEPEFLLRKELIRDAMIQDAVLVIAIAPLVAILPFENFITLAIGAVISIITIWVSYYFLIRKI